MRFLAKSNKSNQHLHKLVKQIFSQLFKRLNDIRVFTFFSWDANTHIHSKDVHQRNDITHTNYANLCIMRWKVVVRVTKHSRAFFRSSSCVLKSNCYNNTCSCQNQLSAMSDWNIRINAFSCICAKLCAKQMHWTAFQSSRCITLFQMIHLVSVCLYVSQTAAFVIFIGLLRCVSLLIDCRSWIH